jgi:hypothetical protein
MRSVREPSCRRPHPATRVPSGDHAPPQGLALQELRDGVGGVRLPAEIVDGEDVRMGERGHCPRFALEAGQGVAILG